MSNTNNTVERIPYSKYRKFGNTGLRVSPICFGCMSFGSSKWQNWVLEEEESMKLLKRAYDLGINFFDTADMYSNGESERILGKFLKQNNIPREEVVIATKVFFPVDKSGEQKPLLFQPEKVVPNTSGLSRKHIMHAVEDSLQRLGTDYIDLYIIHRWDNNTPIEETMEALHDLVKSGKVRYIGASSMWAWQFAKAQFIAEKRGWTKFVSMQNLYNLIYREEERDMIPLCRDLGVTVTPWSPIARGILARAHEFVNTNDFRGTTVRSGTDPFLKMFENAVNEGDKEILRRVSELSKKKNVTPAQLAIAWVLHKPGVSSPVIGATKLENVDLNVAAVNIELSADDLKYLEEPYKAKAVQGGLQ
ncbi:hypothetical protein C9374_008983 [Naegleria lovaniensis]|uniref:NADP-dependent oxidoreductase domain-containing protein n=1 Tax=Naegleria lovaniensis TaxID=51637 RepID=A0AA88GG27_NAELO|nr:uncharacterized protein C9374_008983 [Naegleria lovaniensis]KAG2377898.1 hypothetical protein C9374_008983 [Naegleria lovaniensis]